MIFKLTIPAPARHCILQFLHSFHSDGETCPHSDTNVEPEVKTPSPDARRPLPDSKTVAKLPTETQLNQAIDT
jgi:hypothetical protein